MIFARWWSLLAQDSSAFSQSLGFESWNVSSSIGIEHWLRMSQSDKDKQRLHACGNVVIPQQAKMAMTCFSTLLKAAQSVPDDGQ